MKLRVEGSNIIYGFTVTVKSVTLQRDGESESVNSTGMVDGLLDGARILSVEWQLCELNYAGW